MSPTRSSYARFHAICPYGIHSPSLATDCVSLVPIISTAASGLTVRETVSICFCQSKKSYRQMPLDSL